MTSASVEAFSLSLSQVLEITQRLKQRFDDFERHVTALENAYVRSEAPALRAELEQVHADFKEELRTKMEEFMEAFPDPAAAAVTHPAALLSGYVLGSQGSWGLVFTLMST
jgi:hypothetical protein